MNRRESIASVCGTISLALAFIIAATHDTSLLGLLAMFAAFALCAVASFILK